MKFYAVFLFLISYSLYSQVDKGTSIAIPATKKPNTATSTSIPPSTSIAPNIDFSTFSKPKSDKFKIGESEGVNFGGKTETFADPAEEYTKNMNKKSGKDNPEFAKKEDIHYGQFTITSDNIVMMYRDYGNVDGDMVKVVLNDVTIYSSITLYGELNQVSIPMNMGINKLEIFALNEGLYTPNTAQFNLLEGKKLMISAEWNLLTGFKAMFIINRVK